MFELILDKCQKDPDPIFKIPIFWIRIRPKMDRIRNPGYHPWNAKQASNDKLYRNCFVVSSSKILVQNLLKNLESNPNKISLQVGDTLGLRRLYPSYVICWR